MSFNWIENCNWTKCTYFKTLTSRSKGSDLNKILGSQLRINQSMICWYTTGSTKFHSKLSACTNKVFIFSMWTVRMYGSLVNFVKRYNKQWCILIFICTGTSGLTLHIQVCHGTDMNTWARNLWHSGRFCSITCNVVFLRGIFDVVCVKYL